ncbi:hypothetical protein SESBI_18178 [Sesbania bispinosa]|nr:hypothetical protein SESBI_18178 [Sesbania bispinosa]
MNVVKAGMEQGQTHQQQDRARKGYDHRGRNFSAKTGWADHQRPEPAGNYSLAAMTPLNTTRARILREVYQSDLIRLPPQAEGPKGPDMNKWIERLIKEGYMERYVEKRKDRGDRDRRRDEEGSGSKRHRDNRHKEGRELDPREDFFERRPQPTEELEEVTDRRTGGTEDKDQLEIDWGTKGRVDRIPES